VSGNANIGNAPEEDLVGALKLADAEGMGTCAEGAGNPCTQQLLQVFGIALT